MNIKIYEPKYCQQVYHLFYQTVHTINQKDYNKSQLDSWAPLTTDLKKWCQSLLDNYTIVIESNETTEKTNNKKIIGFGDITMEGYLNRLYVHKDYNGKGIGTLIANELETHAISLGLLEITTHASITAKPFFEKRGYQLITEQTVERNGQQLINYCMKKQIRNTP